MTIAYWCVLAAILLPYVWTLTAKISSGFRPRDNHVPREYLDRLPVGPAKRAHWAQLNTFESIPGFMAAVIVAHQAGAAQATIDALALAFIGLRLAYGWPTAFSMSPIRPCCARWSGWRVWAVLSRCFSQRPDPAPQSY